MVLRGATGEHGGGKLGPGNQTVLAIGRWKSQPVDREINLQLLVAKKNYANRCGVKFAHGGAYRFEFLEQCGRNIWLATNGSIIL